MALSIILTLKIEIFLHGLDRPDPGWQLHMVLAWQVSDRGGSDQWDQLHMVQSRQVSDWIWPDCWAELHLVQCWKVPDRVWSDCWSQLHMVRTRKVPDRVRSAIYAILYLCMKCKFWDFLCNSPPVSPLSIHVRGKKAFSDGCTTP